MFKLCAQSLQSIITQHCDSFSCTGLSFNYHIPILLTANKPIYSTIHHTACESLTIHKLFFHEDNQ